MKSPYARAEGPKKGAFKPSIEGISTFSIEKAYATQLKLSKRVIRRDELPERIRYVGGVDIAYAGDLSIGAAAVLDFESSFLIEFQTSCLKTAFPYIPTLLSFREIPPAVSAIRKLSVQPDIILVDGQGIAHPRAFGFASHLGVVLNKPTVGVAKSLLYGKVGRLEEGQAPILKDDDIIGAAVFTKEGFRPVYVSIGHKVSLETAIALVKRCIRDNVIPEPIRIAHLKANEAKRRMRSIGR